MLLAVDLHEDLINEESVSVAWVPTLQPFGISRSKLDAPQTNRLIADGNPPLGQQIFDVAVAEVESEVEPHRGANDVRRESMAFVQRFGSTHPTIVIQPRLTCQYHDTATTPFVHRARNIRPSRTSGRIGFPVIRP